MPLAGSDRCQGHKDFAVKHAPYRVSLEARSFGSVIAHTLPIIIKAVIAHIFELVNQRAP